MMKASLSLWVVGLSAPMRANRGIYSTDAQELLDFLGEEGRTFQVKTTLLDTVWPFLIAASAIFSSALLCVDFWKLGEKKRKTSLPHQAKKFQTMQWLIALNHKQGNNHEEVYDPAFRI